MRQTLIHDARHSQRVALQYCTFILAVTKKKLWVMEKKLLTYLNSVLKVLLGTDSFPRVPKKS
jgi:hypothetical protein